MRSGIYQFDGPGHLAHPGEVFLKPADMLFTSPHVGSVTPVYVKICGQRRTDFMLEMEVACVGLNKKTCGYRGDVEIPPAMLTNESDDQVSP